MNLAKYDLNLLVALDALLTEKNVTHAGDRIGLSQSAMSGVLSRLRHMFKDELLVRVGRRMELTPRAQELIEPLRACIHEVEDLLTTRLSFDPLTEQRIFTIAASDYSSLMLLGPLILRLTELAPGIAVRVVQLDPSKLDQLSDDTIDFLIMPSEVPASFPAQVLFEDRWVCAVCAHNSEVGPHLTEREYLALPHLIYSATGQDSIGVGDGHLSSIGVHRHVGASVQSFLLAPFVISGTRMITLLHKKLAERLSSSVDIRLIEPPFALPPIHESLFWNPRRTSDPAHVWMRSQIAEVASKI
jgi:LysR family nod box-dependent transcriptional activator